MSKTGMVAGIRMKKLASVTALLLLAAQPVLGYEDKPDCSSTYTKSVSVESNKDPYAVKMNFYRNEKKIPLRYGTQKWGFRHIREKHGWSNFQKYGTALTLEFGKKESQDKEGSYRYDYKFEYCEVEHKWRVVVQHTKTYEGEPKPKHIITSHERK
jgi:hypothetical protein